MSRYLKVPVPEDLYLPVLAFIGAGGKTASEELDPVAVAAVAHDEEIARLIGERNRQADEIRELTFQIDALRRTRDELVTAVDEARGQIVELRETIAGLKVIIERGEQTVGPAEQPTFAAPTPVDVTELPEDIGEQALAIGGSIEDVLDTVDEATAPALPEPAEALAEPSPEELAKAEYAIEASEREQPDGVAPPPTEAPRVTAAEEPEVDLVALRALAAEKRWSQRAIAEAMGVSENVISRAYYGKESPEITRQLAAWILHAPAREPGAATKVQPPKAPSAEGVTGAERDALADRFVKECIRRRPGKMLLSGDLPGAYEQWAKATGSPHIHHRWLGSAMRRAGFTGKLQHYAELKKSAQTYHDAALSKGAIDTADLRATMSRLPGREVVLEDNEVAEPPAEPTPKPAPPVPGPRGRERITPVPVRIFSADGNVATLEERATVERDDNAEPLKPEDADKGTYDLWLAVRDGMRDRPLSFLPEVLALEGVDTDQLEQTVKHPTSVEIRPESRSKGYPVIGFRRGDVKVIVGYRDQTSPAVIAAYWDALLAPNRHHTVVHSGGGGAKKATGLPTTLKGSVKALRQRGYDIPDDWETSPKAVEVSYDGQKLGKLTVGTVNRTQVQADYQRLLRQGHAIDRRKGVAV